MHEEDKMSMSNKQKLTVDFSFERPCDCNGCPACFAREDWDGWCYNPATTTFEYGSPACAACSRVKAEESRVSQPSLGIAEQIEQWQGAMTVEDLASMLKCSKKTLYKR